MSLLCFISLTSRFAPGGSFLNDSQKGQCRSFFGVVFLVTFLQLNATRDGDDGRRSCVTLFSFLGIKATQTDLMHCTNGYVN